MLYQNPGSNALQAANKAKKRMAELAQHFPPDMQSAMTLDTTIPITEGAREIVKTLLEAIALVIVVVVIFLQSWRATLIPVLTVPVSLVGAFLFFPAVGFTTNSLSLLGLVLAVGLVVDDAIVVVEAIEVKIAQGRSPREAAIEAMDEVGGALVGIALVLSAVFIPAGFLVGITGSLYRQFALTIAFSVIVSAFNALTLSPALGALLLRTRDDERANGPLGRFFAWLNRGFARIPDGYTSICALLIRKLALAIIVLVGFIVLAGGLGKIVPTSFVPDEDQGYFIMNIQLPEAASLQRTSAVMSQVDEILKHQAGIQHYVAIAGYSILSQVSSTRSGLYFCQLTPYDQRRKKQLFAQSIIDSVNHQLAALPEAQAFAFPPPAIPGIGQAGGFDLMIQDKAGQTVDYLWDNTQKFLAEAKKRPELGRMNVLFNPATPQLFAALDKEKVFKLGLSTTDVYGTLQALLGGLYVNQFNRFGRVWKVFVEAEPGLSSKARGCRTILRPQQVRRDGAAVDAG